MQVSFGGAASLIIFSSSLSCLLFFTHCLDARIEFDPLAKLDKIRLLLSRKSNTTNSVNTPTPTPSPSVGYSSIYLAPQKGLKETDKISKLPGQPNVSFDQYSGYVTVDPTAGRALFYYFVESQNSSSKPLVLWLNGGPGCSSFGSGAMTEIGPFRVNPDGKTLSYNNHSWTTLANILFLESPARVGFSYSNTSSAEYNTDEATAQDSYTFLINWFERFPEYKSRDFYITGESYAGHYAPQLASLILKNNNIITNQIAINLKGIAMGNPEIDYEDELKGIFEYYWTHALISDEDHNAIVSNCNFSSSNSSTEACNKAIDRAYAVRGTVYIYDIYAPLCSSSPPDKPPSISVYDPCSDNYTFAYLNTPQVQKALHANITGSIPGPWDVCNYTVYKKWNYTTDTVLPTIKELMGADGIRVWIYSGDTDGRVPVTSTKYSMVKLGKAVLTPWYAWYTQNEVGGYVVGYSSNVTFVTIRGAGHYVPSYQPQRALAMFSSFLQGKLPPPSPSPSTPN